MSSIYNKSSIEIKAKELLHSLQRTCPDSVWQELNFHLTEDFSGTRNKITNKLFSPRVLIIALVAIGAVTLLLLKFSGNLDFASKSQNIVVAPKPQPVTPPVKKETPPPPPPKPVVVDSTHIKDSLARIAFIKDSIAKKVALQEKQAPPPVATVTKVDTAALRRYNERLVRRHRRDSLAVLARENAKQDTSAHTRRHHARDSVISVKTDTVH